MMSKKIWKMLGFKFLGVIMSKSFKHPTLGKIIGYSNIKEFDKAIKEYNNKETLLKKNGGNHGK